MAEVCIVETGAANMASVRAWLARSGVTARVTTDPSEVERADAVVLPGVGAFGAAARRLGVLGLVEPLRERVTGGRPTLCICLGMQLLFEASEEAPGVRGLAVIPGVVRRLPASVRTPHMGWNRVGAVGAEGAERGEFAYFANSYAALEAPEGWRASCTSVGAEFRFVSGVERRAVMACQFHPELSSTYGVDLLSRWLRMVPEEAPC